MRVNAVSTLRKFWGSHPGAEQPIKAWFDEAIQAKWLQPVDIKAQYNEVDAETVGIE
ncbi:hypothetical protein [Castellaniella sp.]|uniref:hypothetical protein n=1 Tax=Castellaniella sp. TaxID=1955812 RepID=UPI002AFEA1DF|nr:hypothetical protein [Castellaniella sp.]